MSAIGEYLWWLLPGFLKKKGAVDPASSTTWNLVTIQGETLDASKGEIISMRAQHAVETAEGEQLDLLGEERETRRFESEADAAYRQRIFQAAARKQKVGTKPHMLQMLVDLGFGAQVVEVWTITRRYWAEFIVRLWDAGRPITVTQDELYREVDLNRPAHARAVYVIELPLDTYDDNESFDQAKAFDSWRLP
ncbi:hypothetical protein K8I61_16690 [bacterium]|nr:hypothetical protein [bacterium]